MGFMQVGPAVRTDACRHWPHSSRRQTEKEDRRHAKLNTICSICDIPSLDEGCNEVVEWG
jgi:hypothetical protein